MRMLLVPAAALLLSGCFIEPSDASRGPIPPEAAATDAMIASELASLGALDVGFPRRYDGAARLAGLSSGSELIAALEGDCLAPRDLERFADARGLTVATARLYLSRRFGARICR
ncbi:MAG: hypothetical protein KGL74_04635 [Elusimicrobia bacterium]|nr:hypothetical protein [Elusimicrobiota bacterium]MDE2510387.1 hypothetical protein [Elusimicrobiota bacterium]